MLPFGKPNPFHPGTGAIPPVLAGRDRLKHAFREQLDNLGNPPSDPTPRVLLGPRGCGKTSLLNWVAIKAGKKKLPIVSLASDSISSVDAISREMARQFPPTLLDRVRGFIKEIRLDIGEIGGRVGLGDGRKEEKAKELRTWLETLGGVLLIDEAHNMPPEIGEIFYNAVQDVGTKHPLMVVIAGTPDLESVLVRSKATFIERVPAESIGRLERNASRQALFEPFGKHIVFKEEVMEQILEDAQDYPYFIQLWGSALWEELFRTRTHSPGLAVVNEALKTVNKQRSRLYSRRVQELDNSGLLVPFAEMAWRLGEGKQPTNYDFNMAIQHFAPHQDTGEHDQLKAKQKLLHTGFIWEPEVGTWEYGIPSLASYVRNKVVDWLLTRLKRRTPRILALQVLDQCYGVPGDSVRDISQKKLFSSIKGHLKESGLEEGDTSMDFIGGFMEENLLEKGDAPESVCLVAPHLVRATVEEAIRRKLLPDSNPPVDEKPDSTPLSFGH